MAQTPSVPNELLQAIFKKLTTPDILSCTQTCKDWNIVGNISLYTTVHISSIAMLDGLLHTVTKMHDCTESNAVKISRKRQGLGKLVRVIDVQFRYNSTFVVSFRMSKLNRLSFACPNVHTISISEPKPNPMVMSRDMIDSWEDLGTAWPHLRRLSVYSHSYYVLPDDLSRNMIKMAAKLQYMDVRCGSWFFSCLPPSAPAFPSLQCLKVRVATIANFRRLKQIVAGCRNTLETLSISWKAPSTPDGLEDISPLILESPKLRAFGLSWKSNSSFRLASFGDRLEHIELVGRDSPQSLGIDQVVGEALVLTSGIKTLCFVKSRSIEEYIYRSIDNNWKTLEEIYVYGLSGNAMLAALKSSAAVLTKVTTICMHVTRFNLLSLCLLPDMFPAVQFLDLRQPAISQLKEREYAKVFDMFQYLKSVKVSSGPGRRRKTEFIDPAKNYKFNYAQYELMRPPIFTREVL